jgi:hypothetical protein
MNNFRRKAAYNAVLGDDEVRAAPKKLKATQVDIVGFFRGSPAGVVRKSSKTRTLAPIDLIHPRDS